MQFMSYSWLKYNVQVTKLNKVAVSRQGPTFLEWPWESLWADIPRANDAVSAATVETRADAQSPTRDHGLSGKGFSSL